MSERQLDGRYRLIDRIGSGGMGEVWRAYDANLHREVAVKLITELAYAQNLTATARFVREARAVARLSSPHIVTVHELGTARMGGGPEVPYLVMELLDGRPLDRLLKSAGWLPPLDEVARWTDQLCRALGTAHAAGVVHRDMKPANVLLTGGDTAFDDAKVVKVLDFGIARFLDGTTRASTTLTATGSVMGTPAYMSPEQARGEADVDGRGDLYCLGVVLYELVTGRLPFEGSAWHVVLHQHITEPPAPPRLLRAGLPQDWDELILALLAKNPADRPQTAAEVRYRLGAMAMAPTAFPRARPTLPDPGPSRHDPPLLPPPAPTEPPRVPAQAGPSGVTTASQAKRTTQRATQAEPARARRSRTDPTMPATRTRRVTRWLLRACTAVGLVCALATTMAASDISVGVKVLAVVVTVFLLLYRRWHSAGQADGARARRSAAQEGRTRAH
ncbi:protein kinase [Streptomyces sp. NPDC059582]|uniref:protein kinase domain-containing protein n=1 Tax=Streptomyces sp. NPDC059582 TaxID=3346875 RepID=UPI00368DD1C4